MAEKRMFSQAVVTSDAFLDMPADAQVLYFQLNMASDDRGICDRPRTIMRMCRASDDIMKILIAKKFVLIPKCNEHLIVIKHWRVNNNMRTERFKETKYLEVLQELYYDENRSYSQNPGDGHVPCLPFDDTKLLPSGTQEAPNGYTTGDQWCTDGVQDGTQPAPTPAPKCTPPRHPTGTHPGTQRVPQNRIDKSRVDETRQEDNTLSSQLSAGKRGSGGENQAHTDFQQPIVENPVEKPDSPERLETVRVWRKRIELVKKMGHPTDSMYNLAFAQDGISREEIDSFPEDRDAPS